MSTPTPRAPGAGSTNGKPAPGTSSRAVPEPASGPGRDAIRGVNNVGFGAARNELPDAPRPVNGGGSPSQDHRPAPPKNWYDKARDRGETAILAHRGNIEGGAAPNSLDSLDATARDRVSDAVEMDIETLEDGTLVVYHDGDDESIDDIHGLDAGDLEAHPQIPTLDEWARRAGEHRVNVMAEFKDLGLDGDEDGEKDGRIGRALDVLQHYVKPQNLVMMSFDSDAVSAVHASDSSIPVGFVPERGEDASSVPEQVDAFEDARGFRPDFIEIADADITVENFDEMDDRGVGVMVGEGTAAEQDWLAGHPLVRGILTDLPTQAHYLREDTWRVNDDGSTSVIPASEREYRGRGYLRR